MTTIQKLLTKLGWKDFPKHCQLLSDSHSNVGSLQCIKAISKYINAMKCPSLFLLPSSSLLSSCRSIKTSESLQELFTDCEVVKKKSNGIFWHPNFIRLDLSQSRSGLKDSRRFLQSCHRKSLQVEVSKTAQQKLHHRHLARAGECAAGSLPTVPNASNISSLRFASFYGAGPFRTPSWPKPLRFPFFGEGIFSPTAMRYNALQAWEAAVEMLRRRWHKRPPQRPSKPPCHNKANWLKEL